jgi:carboxypeptidase C (cathepsin A)
MLVAGLHRLRRLQLVTATVATHAGNYVGNSRWVANLTWTGKPDGQQPHPQPWEVEGEPAGLVTDYGMLQFLRIFSAGHMVPMDQPKHALAMLRAFVTDQAFVLSSSDAKAASAAGEAVVFA